MTIISGPRLLELLNAPLAERLVVAPILEPDEQVRGNQASIDVRLGSEPNQVVAHR